MEIKVDRNELIKCVSRVQSIIERKNNMPILSCILLTSSGSELTLSATDLELGFQQNIPVEVINEGSLTVSGRKLFEILKESRSPIFHIQEKEGNRVYLSDNAARFELACLPVEDFPAFVEPEGVSMVEMDGKTITEMINKTIYAVTKENVGFKLSGVLVQKNGENEKSFLRMVATDGHRLSMIDRSVDGIDSLEVGDGILIPKKGMSEWNKIASEGGSVRFGFRDRNCVIKKQNVLLVIRLLDAKFPDYKSVIPDRPKHIVDIDRLSLIKAMRNMMILSNERYKAVKMILEDNTMEVSSTNPDIGEGLERLSIEYTGMRLEAGFNPQYFLETLQAMESETIQIGFIDNSMPCILTGEADDGFLGLLMPMRL